jgi:plasmid stabilization system protein ParE
MKLLWHKEFADELESAAKFYRDRNSVIVQRFFRDFESTLQRIQNNPQLGSIAGKTARRRRIPRFPFDIIYCEHNGALVLIALAHHARRPGYWKGRI